MLHEHADHSLSLTWVVRIEPVLNVMALCVASAQTCNESQLGRWTCVNNRASSRAEASIWVLGSHYCRIYSRLQFSILILAIITSLCRHDAGKHSWVCYCGPCQPESNRARSSACIMECRSYDDPAIATVWICRSRCCIHGRNHSSGRFPRHVLFHRCGCGKDRGDNICNCRLSPCVQLRISSQA